MLGSRLSMSSLSPQSQPLSYLRHDDTLYFARHTRVHAREPMSATVKLIQGIYATQPEFARKILRNRIYSTDLPTEMCLSMVKVAAKSLTFLERAEVIDFASGCGPFTEIEMMAPGFQPVPNLETQQTTSNDFWMSLAKNLAETTPTKSRENSPLFERDRKVAAILVSRDGKLLGNAINRNSSNRTLHAEINLVQSFYARTGTALPRGCRIYSTLKPCKMCAGMIWHSSEETQIIYDQFDPGPSGRSTILDPDSFERKRACNDLSQGEHVSQVAYSTLQLRIAAR